METRRGPNENNIEPRSHIHHRTCLIFAGYIRSRLYIGHKFRVSDFANRDCRTGFLIIFLFPLLFLLLLLLLLLLLGNWGDGDEAPQSVLVADGYARVRSDVDLCREMLEREWEGKRSNQSNLSVGNVHG